MTSTGAILNGRYELIGCIGSGGCAEVFAASDLVMKRVVAVKIATPSREHPDAGERLLREARAAGAILHPNVCAVHDIGVDHDGRPFMVMPRLYGTTLREHLTLTRVSPSYAIDVVLQLLSAVEASHEAGFLHRDIKPENIFLLKLTGSAALVQLLDFGICCQRSASGRAADTMLTAAGRVVGTPEYMAPEQALGLRAFDLRLDVWAAGVVLYEALTRTRPFRAKDAQTSMNTILRATLPPPSALCPGLPAELDIVAMRALDRDPDARYRSARSFQEELRRVASRMADVADIATEPVTCRAPAPPAKSGQFSIAELPTRHARVGVRPRSPSR